MGSRTAGATAAVVVAALVLLGAPATAQDGPGGPVAGDTDAAGADVVRTAAEAARVAAEARLAQAQQQLAATQSRAGGVEARRAALESELVAAAVEHGARRAVRDEARTAHSRRAEDRREAQQRREVEHTRLVAQAVAAYKLGVARSHVMAVEVLVRATEGDDVAASLYEIESVVDHQLEVSLREKVALAAAEIAEARALRAWEGAVDAAWEAGRLVVALESEVGEARARAASAEQRTIGAMAAVAAAQEALDRLRAEQAADPRLQPAGGAPAATAPGAGEAAAVPAPGEEPLTAAHVSARARALARVRALTPADLALRTGLECPVAGAVFGNDWHYPRHPHRLHEGTDLFAPEGTPVRAVADATVVALDRVDTHGDGDSDLGGVWVSYETAAGDRWYNAHLSEIAPSVEVGTPLRRGQQLGTVGHSGNAAGTPAHLHLGLYVGAAAVNPWPSLELACGAGQDTASTSGG